MSEAKVCLINPPTTGTDELVYFPLALLALGGILRDANVATEVWDYDLYCKQQHTMSPEVLDSDLKRRVRQSKANIFGISSICSNLPMALWMAQQIKKYRPGALIIFGGAQPSSTPHRILECFPDIDAIVVGEGEETLMELIRADFDPEAFSSIEGVASRKDGDVIYTPRAGLIQDLDDLPMPDFSLIDLTDYKSLGDLDRGLTIEAGRGCPFTCTFCSTALMWHRRYRMKSAERIIAEVRMGHSICGETLFDLIHDNFTTSKKFITQFCGLWLGQADPDWRWSISSRVDCLTIDQMEMMAEARLKGIFFGIESGSARMQRVIDKRLQLDGFEKILQCGRGLALNMTTAFILGFPEERIEDMDETLRRAVTYKVHGAERVFFTKLAPLAGTKVYHEYVNQLKVMPNETTVSPLTTVMPHMESLVVNYPDLFSSFYHVPHPELSALELCQMVEYGHMLVRGIPEVAHTLFESRVCAPTELFRMWCAWLRKPGVTKMTRQLRTFPAIANRFLTDEFFSRPTVAGSIATKQSLNLAPN